MLAGVLSKLFNDFIKQEETKTQKQRFLIILNTDVYIYTYIPTHIIWLVSKWQDSSSCLRQITKTYTTTMQ